MARKCISYTHVYDISHRCEYYRKIRVRAVAMLNYAFRSMQYRCRSHVSRIFTLSSDLTNNNYQLELLKKWKEN